MEHQDNIFEQFKKAAENQESQDFPGMEKVWSRVDAKLDTQVFKAQRKTNSGWQKFAVAASIVIGSVFAFQIIKQFNTVEPAKNPVVETNNKKVTTILANDSIQVAMTEVDSSVIDKKQVERVIEQQLKQSNPVALSNVKPMSTSQPKVMATAPVMLEEQGDLNEAKNYEADVRSESMMQELKKEKSQSPKVEAKKADALVVVDGKVSNRKASDVKTADDLENIVELKDPLYIINGKEYSEKELFGPNPTSPYYPLNKQEIESISIYQNDEAIEQFGGKGEKGVVVIKTKNGKPAIVKK